MVTFCMLRCACNRRSFEQKNYLGSLKNAAPLNFDDLSRTQEEHNAKEHSMAGCAGYRDEHWGGYLDNLLRRSFEEGKKSDYGMMFDGALKYAYNL